MSLTTPDKIRSLQRKLYCKAKAEPAFRFYVLYDKICREDILNHAYRMARANAGAPGVDGMSFAQIEERGLETWLAGLREELVSKTYRPDSVRRVMIPKHGGGERALGIPTIRDRVVQTAAKLVLEPIFEADFEDNAYGYRPARGAADAVKDAYRHLTRGYTDVVDADLSRYFDSIPHDDLLKSVARRVADGSVLRLIKLWLKAPIEERDGGLRPPDASFRGFDLFQQFGSATNGVIRHVAPSPRDHIAQSCPAQSKSSIVHERVRLRC
jgi:RNA-directed DNA polymerase